METGKQKHHAYCFVGDAQTIVSGIRTRLDTEWGFQIEGNPDFQHSVHDILHAEAARDITEAARLEPIGDKKIFIIQTNLVTLVAQNAFLKAFEEPTGNTHFFLVVPTAEWLLPTLRSRLEIVEEGTIGSSEEAKTFLASSVGKRFAHAHALAADISDERASKMRAILFLGALATALRESADILDQRVQNALSEIEQARQYASEQSPSLKMLLEHIALVTPVLKK